MSSQSTGSGSQARPPPQAGVQAGVKRGTGHTCTQTSPLVYLKFKTGWMSRILSATSAHPTLETSHVPPGVGSAEGAGCGQPGISEPRSRGGSQHRTQNWRSRRDQPWGPRGETVGPAPWLSGWAGKAESDREGLHTSQPEGRPPNTGCSRVRTGSARDAASPASSIRAVPPVCTS